MQEPLSARADPDWTRDQARRAPRANCLLSGSHHGHTPARAIPCSPCPNFPEAKQTRPRRASPAHSVLVQLRTTRRLKAFPQLGIRRRPMEAAVACRGGGVLARPLPGHKARRHHGVGPARRRFLAVASLGEPPSAPSRDAVALAQEIALVDEYVPSTVIPDDPVETVQVKFVLQKQCAFGQRFLVVGDDPALGLWDPTKATALEWSEHHVWTAKMDLPANKSVEFKFLLQDPSGHVSWQHGHNRTLQINETSNTLVVYEDWDDAKCQELSEVVYPSIGAEDVVHFAGSCNGAMLTDDNQVDVNQEIDEDLTVVVGTGGGSSPLREKLEANGANWSQFTLGEDQKVPEVLRRRANMAAQSGNPAADYAGRNGDNTLYEEGAPAENRPATMFENDMVWLGEALQRLLQSLGLKIGTTKT